MKDRNVHIIVTYMEERFEDIDKLVVPLGRDAIFVYRCLLTWHK